MIDESDHQGFRSCHRVTMIRMILIEMSKPCCGARWINSYTAPNYPLFCRKLAVYLPKVL